MLAASLAAILTGGSGFAVGSPVQVATGLLGGYRLVAAALLLPAAAGLVLVMREHVWARYAAALAAAAVVLVWLAAPAYLAPRFFIWLLPAVAFGVAVAVTRWRVLAIVVLAIVAAEVYKTAHDYTAPEVANLQAAQIARHVESAGGTACAFEPSARAIQVYDPAIKVVAQVRHQTPSCRRRAPATCCSQSRRGRTGSRRAGWPRFRTRDGFRRTFRGS